MKNLLTASLIIITLISCQKQSERVTTVAFGSCSDQDSKQQLWSEINDSNPDVFVFLGDNIYGDTHNFDTLKAKYQKQKNDDELGSLFANTHILGTWDDHDYGVNDGGKNYSLKDSSKLLFLDFMEIEDKNPIRSHEGVYNSYTYNNEGKSIKFIMLDTRYFRDTLSADTTSQNLYLPNHEGTILGNEQWQWLEKELKNNNTDAVIIGSSIQVLSNQHHWEKWANFPNERSRLFAILKDQKNVIIISGDRHIAELSKYEHDNGNVLFDFTSSGLTHTWSESRDEPNEFRVSELIAKKNYGLIKFDWRNNAIIFSVMGTANNEIYSSKHSLK